MCFNLCSPATGKNTNIKGWAELERGAQGQPFMVCPLYGREPITFKGGPLHSRQPFVWLALWERFFNSKAILTLMVVKGSEDGAQLSAVGALILYTTLYLIHQYISTHTKYDAPWIVHWLYNVPGFPVPGWVRQDCWGVSKHQP